MVRAAKWRYAYDGYEIEMSGYTGIDCSGDKDFAVQSGKDDADINVIMKRFGLSGEMPQARSVPEYGDFSYVGDYQSALHQVMEANAAFAALPSDVRRRFDNDPGKLWSFVHDEANRDEARRLGLLEPEPVVAPPMRVQVVPDPVLDADVAS